MRGSMIEDNTFRAFRSRSSGSGRGRDAGGPWLLRVRDAKRSMHFFDQTHQPAFVVIRDNRPRRSLGSGHDANAMGTAMDVHS